MLKEYARAEQRLSYSSGFAWFARIAPFPSCMHYHIINIYVTFSISEILIGDAYLLPMS